MRLGDIGIDRQGTVIARQRRVVLTKGLLHVTAIRMGRGRSGVDCERGTEQAVCVPRSVLAGPLRGRTGEAHRSGRAWHRGLPAAASRVRQAARLEMSDCEAHRFARAPRSHIPCRSTGIRGLIAKDRSGRGADAGSRIAPPIRIQLCASIRSGGTRMASATSAGVSKNSPESPTYSRKVVAKSLDVHAHSGRLGLDQRHRPADRVDRPRRGIDEPAVLLVFGRHVLRIHGRDEIDPAADPGIDRH